MLGQKNRTHAGVIIICANGTTHLTNVFLVIDICSREKTSLHTGMKTPFVLYSQLKELLHKNTNGQSKACFLFDFKLLNLEYSLTNILCCTVTHFRWKFIALGGLFFKLKKK